MGWYLGAVMLAAFAIGVRLKRLLVLKGEANGEAKREKDHHTHEDEISQGLFCYRVFYFIFLNTNTGLLFPSPLARYGGTKKNIECVAGQGLS